VLLGPLAAEVALAGWGVYFGVSIVAALPGLALVLALRRRVLALDDAQSS